MTAGWVCLAISVLLFMIALVPSSATASYSGFSTDDFTQSTAEAARQWIFQVGAGSFFSLFLVFWSVGYIARAISFLPGRSEH